MILIRIQFTIWTLCAFRALNPHQKYSKKLLLYYVLLLYFVTNRSKYNLSRCLKYTQNHPQNVEKCVKKIVPLVVFFVICIYFLQWQINLHFIYVFFFILVHCIVFCTRSSLYKLVLNKNVNLYANYSLYRRKKSKRSDF